MKENFKLEKELLFKNNIKDITSISLDSDFKLDGYNLTGTFIISGEYKIHEVSINREKFNFKLPFNHKINNDIDLDTIKLDIENFVYDYSKDELIVNIEYEITGSRKDVLVFDNEENLDKFLQDREVEVIDDRINDIKEEIKESDKNNNEILEDEKKEIDERKEELSKIEPIIEKKDNEKDLNEDIVRIEDNNIISNKIESIKDENREVIEADEVINSVGKVEDNFVTYKIHKVSESDTLETIVLKYHTTLDDLKEFNDLNDIKPNDKIIIPKYE